MCSQSWLTLTISLGYQKADAALPAALPSTGNPTTAKLLLHAGLQQSSASSSTCPTEYPTPVLPLTNHLAAVLRCVLPLTDLQWLHLVHDGVAWLSSYENAAHRTCSTSQAKQSCAATPVSRVFTELVQQTLLAGPSNDHNSRQQQTRLPGG